jgi:hypothetical protein
VFDKRVTRHERRGTDQALVCVECGRKIDVPRDGAGDRGVTDQRTAPVPTVSELQRSSRRPAKPPARTPTWLSTALVATVMAVAALAVISIIRLITSPTPEIEPLRAAPAPAVAPSAEQPADSSVNAPVNVSPARIAHTDGQGAFIRRTTNLEDRLRAWPDGTQLQVTGAPTEVNGLSWTPVVDPAGNRGWIPSQYISQ